MEGWMEGSQEGSKDGLDSYITYVISLLGLAFYQRTQGGHSLKEPLSTS